MYSLTRPTQDAVTEMRRREATRPVFQEHGEIPERPPPGYRPNVGAGPVGVGESDFRAAIDAVRQWEMFPGGWVTVETGGESAVVGQIAAAVARCFGVWVVNCCRVVYLAETARRFEFTYVTTAGHALRGAERFRVDWRDDDSVWFEVHSISRPREWTAWVVRPQLVALQTRFVQEAVAAVRRGVEQRR